MFAEALSGDTQSSLEILSKNGIVSTFYLAGGSAAALHLCHRYSFDLDFFTQESFSLRGLIDRIEGVGNFIVESQAEDTLAGNLNSIKVSFFRYKYPVLFPFHEFVGVKVLDLRDIGCMKVDAISSRGLRRDFIDLYFICQSGMSLRELLGLFSQKYAGVSYNMTHIVKSLAYFYDAEKDEMPQMIKPVLWDDVRRFFEKEGKQLFKRWLV